MKLARLFLIAVALAILPLFAAVSAPTHQASASLASCGYANHNPYLYGSNVDGYNRLNCQTNADRQSEYCLVFWRSGVDSWYCYVSGEYVGTWFPAEAAKYTCPASGWSVQYWFWDHDYWSGETWSGYGAMQYLNRAPC